MVFRLVRHARLGQAAARRHVAVDAFSRAFMPLDVESVEFGKELQVGIGQVVMNPPRHSPPVSRRRQPGNDDAGGRPHMAVTVAQIPDMTSAVGFV